MNLILQNVRLSEDFRIYTLAKSKRKGADLGRDPEVATDPEAATDPEVATDSEVGMPRMVCQSSGKNINIYCQYTNLEKREHLAAEKFCTVYCIIAFRRVLFFCLLFSKSGLI